ncbi:hypothetical protein Hanom_Chr09g00850711 [Helianthus anomalus]
MQGEIHVFLEGIKRQKLSFHYSFPQTFWWELEYKKKNHCPFKFITLCTQLNRWKSKAGTRNKLLYNIYCHFCK